ncbi:MAG: hypothetical protein JO058_21040 [Alphaproteobacteria bacterium]|nr:hypothetical protein [Alphaproteobacteria bacterium]
MIRSALLLCATLLAALTFGCEIPPTTPPGPGQRTLFSGWGLAAAYGPQVMACDPSPFVNKVYTLDYRYDPSNYYSGYGYSSPAGVIQVADTTKWQDINNLQQFTSDLGAAYCAASSTFQKQLTDLTAVFISCLDPSNCVPSGQNIFLGSWGYRENAATQSALQHTYVALSADLWPTTLKQPPMKYSQFEYVLLDNLLQIPPPPASQPVTIYANPDTPALTVLAALAHELGHIYWWKLDAENFDCPHNLGFFSDISWKSPPDPTLRFHKFGVEQSPNSAGKGGSVPKSGHNHKDQVKKDIPTNSSHANQDLDNIYDNGYWASMFATVTPDEDFVETYKLWALTAAGLNSLQVTVPGYATAYLVNPSSPIGFFTDGQSDLYAKADWVQSCFAWP